MAPATVSGRARALVVIGVALAGLAFVLGATFVALPVALLIFLVAMGLIALARREAGRSS